MHLRGLQFGLLVLVGALLIASAKNFDSVIVSDADKCRVCRVAVTALKRGVDLRSAMPSLKTVPLRLSSFMSSLLSWK